MDIHEFADFVEDLVDSLRCNFEDLAQFLTLRVAFADSGSAVLDDAIVALVHDSTGHSTPVENFNDAVVEVRMMLLFQMMDWKATGTVPFEDVVKSLFHVTKHMDEIPRKALLMCTDKDRPLEFAQYSSLILNVVAAGSLHFHDVANAMTLAVCKNDVTRTDLSDLFVGDDMYKIAVEEHNRGVNPDSNEIVDALHYGRLNRLFDLWDLDVSVIIRFALFCWQLNCLWSFISSLMLILMFLFSIPVNLTWASLFLVCESSTKPRRLTRLWKSPLVPCYHLTKTRINA